jgi:serine/threonine-protein kinase PRP4
LSVPLPVTTVTTAYITNALFRPITLQVPCVRPDYSDLNTPHSTPKDSTLTLCFTRRSAMFDGNNEITPYLQSRFYRAPEVILGLKYSFPLDMWSLGCCLFELYCGQMAFPGKSNNDMLRLFIETKGPLPRKLLRKAAFKELHYDDDGLFSQAVCDPVTKTEIRRTIRDSKPLRDIHQRVNQRARRDTNLTNEEKKMTTGLGDLLDKIFTFDPEKRITPSNALLHPFCQ